MNKELVPVLEFKTCDRFKLVCKELESINDNLVGITPFILSSNANDVFQFQPFSLLYKATIKPSIEQRIINFIESYPKGVAMRLKELDVDGNEIMEWKITGARISGVNFGEFNLSKSETKIITLIFKALNIEMEY